MVSWTFFPCARSYQNTAVPCSIALAFSLRRKLLSMREKRPIPTHLSTWEEQFHRENKDCFGSTISAMGGQLSKMMGKIFGSKEMRLLMLGLDAAGKTSKCDAPVTGYHVLTWSLAILYKLKLGQDVTTIPTVGFNVESVTYKNVKFNVWDVGGQDKIRPLWRHYFSGTQGLIFVIDSNDRARIDEARQELHRIILDREMKEALLLVFANKQDIPGSMTPTEVSEKLRLAQLKERVWNVVPSCATTGEGLLEGLSWLSNNVKSQPRPAPK